jgi:SAM-dependent methyltransferase
MSSAVDPALAPLLACPRCGAELRESLGAFRCSANACAARFGLAGGQPVLVDFDDSILAEDEVAARSGGSVIERTPSPGIKSRLYRVLLGTSRRTQANAERFRQLALGLAERPTVLIIGGGSRGAGTEALYQDPALRRIVFDIYASQLTDFIADAHRIPLKSQCVDAVWVQAVLEHVLDPWRVAAEIHRVLKPGGIVYAETPFLQHVHEGAYDFTRFTENGHRWLFRRFEAIDSGVVLGAGTTLLWSIEHAARGLFRSVRAGVIVKLLLFWVRGLDRLIPRGYASDAASAVYFLGRKSETAISPRDMVRLYRGANARRD